MKSTNRQIIDNSLFIYGGLVAVILTAIAIFNLQNTNNLLTFILFLPVSIYFIYRALASSITLLNSFFNLAQEEQHPYFGAFSLSTFISQNDSLFLFTILLFSLSLLIILFQTSSALSL